MGLCGSNIFGLTMKLLIILFILCSAFIAYEPAGLTAIHRPEKVTAAAAVQTQDGSNGFSTTVVTTISTTQNNLAVVSIYINNNTTTTVTSVTDNASNTYVVSSPVTSSGSPSFRIYQAYGVQVNSGVTSVTVTLSDADPNYVLVAVDEYSGCETTNATVIDASSSGTGTSTSPSVSTLTTAATGELIVATVGTQFTSAVSAAGSGYTLYGIADGETRMRSMYKLSGAATETAPATLSGSADWGEIAIAYKVRATTNTSNFFLFFKPFP